MKWLLSFFLVSTSVFGLDKVFTYECDEELAAEVESAIAKWNDATGGALKATRVDRGGDVVVRAVDHIRQGFRGWTEIQNNAVRVQIVRSARFREAVVLHEFGHVFGLGHSKDSNSIMWHSAKDKAELSQEDIWKIVRRYGR